MAYGVALEKLGRANPRVVALDGDTKNSTFSDKFRVGNSMVFSKMSMLDVLLVC